MTKAKPENTSSRTPHAISYRYRRSVFPDWPFDLFSMVHARTLEAAERISEVMSSVVKIQDCTILFSTREFKKQRVKYFE
ncbi:MAG: hypothetical protein WCF07_05770 [Nitrososphaeraceae archaeon]